MKKSTLLVMAVAAGSVAGAAVAVLGKYAKEELDLRKEIAPEVDTTRPRIACVGDSITFGDGVVHGRDTQSYPAVLETLLGGEEQVLNYGLNGRTLLAEGDMPYTKEEFYPLSKECGADTYIIMLGTNDTKPQNWNRHAYEQELVEFIRGYQGLPQAPKVYVMVPPRAFAVDGNTEVLYDINERLMDKYVRPMVRQAAEETGAGLIDLYAITEHRPELFADGVHPNFDGNQAIAAEIYMKLHHDRKNQEQK